MSVLVILLGHTYMVQRPQREFDVGRSVGRYSFGAHRQEHQPQWRVGLQYAATACCRSPLQAYWREYSGLQRRRGHAQNALELHRVYEGEQPISVLLHVAAEQWLV